MRATSPPPGYHSVTPSLIVRDADAAVAFYARAFGAVEVGRFTGPDGAVLHAEIRIGDSAVMLGEENAAWGALSPLSTRAVVGALHLYVDDADAAFARALAAGATVRQPLEDAFWGDRYGKVVDPFGHEWGIATRRREMTPAEMQRAGDAWMARAARGAPGAEARGG